MSVIYLNGDLWQSVNGYAAAVGETTFTLPLREEGPHTLELRNRPEKDPRSTDFTIRFKSLVTAATSRQLEVRTTKYSYDALSRLLEAKRVPGQNANSSYYRLDKYLYDVAGNRLAYISGVDGGPPNPFDPAVENYTYDAANRMLTAGSRTLNYDAAGRMTSDGVTFYTWDRAGRLLTDNNAQIQHTYNGDGQRVQQVVAGVTSTYLLDVQPALYQVLAATVSSNTTRYIHGPTGVQSQQDPSGNWTFVFQDGLGSVRVVSDALASTLENRWYTPFSEIVERDGTPQTTFGFTGEPTDTNGLVHLRVRYYNPSLGVFPSLDPLEGELGNPLSLHRYAYVQGNPINLVDPTGMFSCGSELPGVQAACGDLDKAIVWATNMGMSTLGDNVFSGVVSNGNLDYKALALLAESTFSVKIGVYNQQNADQPLPLCSLNPSDPNRKQEEPKLTNAKAALVRTVAAMTYIATRFGEVGNGLALFQSYVGRGRLYFQLNAETHPNAGVGRGFTPLPPCPQTDNLFLGAGVVTSTVVHELGHAFDRNFGKIPSTPLKGLYIIAVRGDKSLSTPTYNGNQAGAELVAKSYGLTGRASAQDLPEEYWVVM